MGSLPEPEEALIEEHLLLCEECRASLKEIDAYVTAMKDAGRRSRAQESHERKTRHLFSPLLGAAAALVAILAAGGIWRAQHNPEMPAVLVHLEAFRGSSEAHAPAGQPLKLAPNLVGLPSAANLRIEVVDSDGNPVWKGTANAQGTAEAPGLRAGSYFVRLFAASGELLREYGLEIAAH